MYIVIAILAFGVMIAVHEFGHFITAKACNVKVNEFAIGMGPAIVKRKKGETLYSLRILPIGGYCSMEGEDEEIEDDPRAFTSQPRWKRLIILVAGSFMNLLLGFVITLLVFSQSSAFGTNTVESVADGFLYGGENGLMAGDTVVSIDGERVEYSADFSTFMARGGDSVDMVIIRGGEKITLKDYPLQTAEYTENGKTTERYGVNFKIVSATFGEKLKYSAYCTGNFVRFVRLGLGDLISGRAGMKDMAGVVGIVDTINTVGEESANIKDALMNVGYICGFIAVNLAVMNMLPIPALDGGRVFFLFITWIIEKISKRRLNPKYEGYVHAAGMVLLLGLMAFVLFNDVVRIING